MPGPPRMFTALAAATLGTSVVGVNVGKGIGELVAVDVGRGVGALVFGIVEAALGEAVMAMVVASLAVDGGTAVEGTAVVVGRGF